MACFLPQSPAPGLSLRKGWCWGWRKLCQAPLVLQGTQDPRVSVGSTPVRWEIPQYLSTPDILFPGGYFTFQSLGSQFSNLKENPP